MDHVKRQKLSNQDEGEEDVNEPDAIPLPIVTLSDAQNALEQLKLFALTHSSLSEDLIGRTIDLSNVFRRIFDQVEKKKKQSKIYDFFVNK